jgi:hypothetical protein
MIDKLNLPIGNKDTKKFKYWLDLDGGFWFKTEYNDEGSVTYNEDCTGFWSKTEYNTRGKVIYLENTTRGIIKDDR